MGQYKSIEVEPYGFVLALKLGTILAYDDRLDNACKVIFMLFQGYSDDDGKCFPSIKKVAKNMRVSRQAIIKQLRLLEKFGYIVTASSYRSNGGRPTNIYHFNFERAKKYFSSPEVFCSRNLVSNSDKELSTEESSFKPCLSVDSLNKARDFMDNCEKDREWEEKMGVKLEDQKELHRIFEQISKKKNIMYAENVRRQIESTAKEKGFNNENTIKFAIEFCKKELNLINIQD